MINATPAFGCSLNTGNTRFLGHPSPIFCPSFLHLFQHSTKYYPFVLGFLLCHSLFQVIRSHLVLPLMPAHDDAHHVLMPKPAPPAPPFCLPLLRGPSCKYPQAASHPPTHPTVKLPVPSFPSYC